MSALAASLARHFAAGCGYLDARQLDLHRETGSCPECRAKTLAAMRAPLAVMA